MNNIIKRTSKTLEIELLTESNAGKAGDKFTITKDDYGWHGGGYLWLTSHLRNNNFIKIIKQY